MKKFLKKTLQGFSQVIETVNDNMPNLKSQLKENQETVNKLKNQVPPLQTQQRDLNKKLEAVNIELETQRKRLQESGKLVSCLFEEVTDMEEGFGLTNDKFLSTRDDFRQLKEEFLAEIQVTKEAAEKNREEILRIKRDSALDNNTPEPENVDGDDQSKQKMTQNTHSSIESPTPKVQIQQSDQKSSRRSTLKR